MAVYDRYGNNVTAKYLNPTTNNSSMGKLQTNTAAGGGTTPTSGMSGTDIAGGVASLAGMAAPLLGDNAAADAVSGISTGVASGAAFGPIGMAAGAVLGGASSILGGSKKRAAARAAKRLAIDKSMMQDAASRTAQMTDDTPDVQVMAYGGKIMEYGGNTHEASSIGGNPVDANGNYTNPDNAVALVEKGEVLWNKGKNDSYIFSDKLGYAKQAKSIMKKYEKRLGKGLDNLDPISRNTMNSKLSKLQDEQEMVKSGIENGILEEGGWIQGAIKKPGSFTAQAKSRGLTPAEFQSKVLANKEDYSSTTVRRANLRKTLVSMGNGGTVPKQEASASTNTTPSPFNIQFVDVNTPASNLYKPTPEKKYLYPDTEQTFKEYQESITKDKTLQDKARLYGYKSLLDKELQKADPKVFSELQKMNYRKPIEEAIRNSENLYKEGKFKGYIDTEGIKKTLGEEGYNDYINLISTIKNPEFDVAGTNEQGQPIKNLKYGLRTSSSIYKPQSGVSADLPGRKGVKYTFGSDMTYNPQTKQYDITFRNPREFTAPDEAIIQEGKENEMYKANLERITNPKNDVTMAKPKMKCGGKLPKMDVGGDLPKLDNTVNIDMSDVQKRAVPLSQLPFATSLQSKGVSSVTPTMGTTSPKIIGNTETTEEPNKTYLGDIVPIAGSTALSMAGTGYALSRLKKPKAINIGRINPQQINLENARESARTSAKEGLANIRSAAKGVGSANYMNEVIAGTVGTQRELGRNLTQSYLAEATANATAKEEANRANVAAAAQEANLNAAREAKYEDTKAALTSNLFSLPMLGASDYLKQKNITDAALMNSPYEFATDPKNRFKRKLKVRKE